MDFRYRHVSEAHRVSDVINSNRRFEPENFNANLHMQPDLFRIDQRGRKKSWISKNGFIVKKNTGIPDINIEANERRMSVNLAQTMSHKSKMYEPYTKISNMGGRKDSVASSQSPLGHTFSS